MKDILTAPWMVEMVRTVTNMYNHGWDERNGGNISLLLDETQVSEYLDVKNVIRTMETGFAAPHPGRKILPGYRNRKIFQERPVCPESQSGSGTPDQ